MFEATKFEDICYEALATCYITAEIIHVLEVQVLAAQSLLNDTGSQQPLALGCFGEVSNQVFVIQLPFISLTRTWGSPPSHARLSRLPVFLLQLLLGLGQLGLEGRDGHLLAGPGPRVLLAQALPELLDLPLQLLPPALRLGREAALGGQLCGQ